MLIIPGTWVCYPGMWTSFVKIYTQDPGIVTRKHGVISQVVGSISQECELHLLIVLTMFELHSDGAINTFRWLEYNIISVRFRLVIPIEYRDRAFLL